jgi:hypothetical protein
MQKKKIVANNLSGIVRLTDPLHISDADVNGAAMVPFFPASEIRVRLRHKAAIYAVHVTSTKLA